MKNGIKYGMNNSFLETNNDHAEKKNSGAKTHCCGKTQTSVFLSFIWGVTDDFPIHGYGLAVSLLAWHSLGLAVGNSLASAYLQQEGG